MRGGDRDMGFGMDGAVLKSSRNSAIKVIERTGTYLREGLIKASRRLPKAGQEILDKIVEAANKCLPPAIYVCIHTVSERAVTEILRVFRYVHAA